MEGEDIPLDPRVKTEDVDSPPPDRLDPELSDDSCSSSPPSPVRKKAKKVVVRKRPISKDLKEHFANLKRAVSSSASPEFGQDSAAKKSRGIGSAAEEAVDPDALAAAALMVAAAKEAGKKRTASAAGESVLLGVAPLDVEVPKPKEDAPAALDVSAEEPVAAETVAVETVADEPVV